MKQPWTDEIGYKGKAVPHYIFLPKFFNKRYEKVDFLHEILHVLGFRHEHARPDANKHLEFYNEKA